jgi:hypothetical protein
MKVKRKEIICIGNAKMWSMQQKRSFCGKKLPIYLILTG